MWLIIVRGEGWFVRSKREVCECHQFTKSGCHAPFPNRERAIYGVPEVSILCGATCHPYLFLCDSHSHKLQLYCKCSVVGVVMIRPESCQNVQSEFAAPQAIPKNTVPTTACKQKNSSWLSTPLLYYCWYLHRRTTF